MSKENLKNKLTQYLIEADDNALHFLHEATLKYENQKVLDKMIAEGEEDIAAGRTVSLEEVIKKLGVH
jgi:predicted transcriptional regulator